MSQVCNRRTIFRQQEQPDDLCLRSADRLYGLQCRIESAIRRIALAQNRSVTRLRDNLLVHLNGGVTSGIHIRPESAAHSGKQCGSESSAFIGSNDLDFVLVDVSLDLSPERRTRSTTAEANLADGHFHFRKDLQGILKAEGHTLENCADNVGATMTGGESYQRAAGVRIEVRCALTHQIRSPQHAIASSRCIR